MGLCLIAALGLHLAPVGVIGLFLMVGLTSMKGIISEHHLEMHLKSPCPSQRC